jgi:sigma-B regulation protein RsbU (phosphoserine phosphatase)
MEQNKARQHILYIDDEKDNLTVFYSTFRRFFEVHLASSGKEGLELMKKHDMQLVIADQRMPEMTGIEFLEKIIPEYPDCVRMVLTGYSDVEAIIQAINKGRVYRYITKPWQKEDLKITIEQALETSQLKRQNRRLVTDLQRANQNLEKKVKERTREITDSIEYASRIQNALLPPEEELDALLPSYFILNKPRNIVSGDYFWVASKNKKVAVAVADCTGHGVPGAFMSILGMAYLNEILNKLEAIRASEILNQLRAQVIRSLHQTGRVNEAKDGMEIALCVVDIEKHILQYSGAFRPLYLFRDNEFIELKGDPMPIGYYHEENLFFQNQEMVFRKNDMIYMFSDGFVDQLGGPHRKTYKSKRFKQLLREIYQDPLSEQKKKLESEYKVWKNNNEQIDDILIMGIRFESD